jgi:riboflavin biosynthesis pyrimidine reductase
VSLAPAYDGEVEPLELLFESPPASAGSLPEPLAHLYGGGLELSSDLVFANLVSSLDGVVALPMRDAPRAIRGASEADRFIAGLLRALADCILVGAGTLRADHGHLWAPSYIHPPSAALFALLGRRLPQLIVVSGNGELDPSERGLSGETLVLTSTPAAQRLAREGVNTEALGSPPFLPVQILNAIRARGHRRILVEAGPRLLSQLVEAELLQELWMTISPVLAGGAGPGRQRSLETVSLLPDWHQPAELRSVRRQRNHLFLRYELTRARVAISNPSHQVASSGRRRHQLPPGGSGES